VHGTLVASNIVKAHGPQLVLRGVSLTVRPGSRIGVVGPNGIGKTTLLRVLAGLEAPDQGAVARAPDSMTAGYLPQEYEARPGETLLGFLARRTGVAAAEAEMDALAARLTDEPDLAGAYSDALDRFLSLGGADLAARAGAACAEVGLEPSLDLPLTALSGGEAARAALAALLLSRFDVYLLDEPTNDLDLMGLERLEGFVDSVEGGVVTVSHDRAFLDRTVTRILEFEPETGRPREYPGGWSEYETARAQARQREEAAYDRYAAERQRFEELLRVRRNQARAGSAMTDRRGTHALMSKVRTAERRLTRLERVEKPWRPWRLQLSLAPGPRGGATVLALAGALVERPGFRLGPVDLELRRGDRVVVSGPNGSGKTTLLGALLGTTELAEGRRRVGVGVVVGELEQRRGEFDLDEPLLEPFGRATGLAPGEARTLLAKFGLGPDELARPARSLSPGERTRTSMAVLAGRGVNCLILDEPTNHLDLEAIEELECALELFEGTVVLVSHDRRFAESFRATRVIRLETGTDSAHGVRHARVFEQYDRRGEEAGRT
jgi:ATPase subunit of ABC transporter with duplicated ATPase domains